MQVALATVTETLREFLHEFDVKSTVSVLMVYLKTDLCVHCKHKDTILLLCVFVWLMFISFFLLLSLRYRFSTVILFVL